MAKAGREFGRSSGEKCENSTPLIPPGDSGLVEMGKHWLERQTDHIAWPFVWEHLTLVLPGDGSLKDLALAWLGMGKPTHKQWASVWNALRACDPAAPELAELGRRWLVQAPTEHPGRAQVEAV